MGASVDELEPDYPSAASHRSTVVLVDAAQQVADANLTHTQAGQGSPVTAFVGDGQITIRDPLA